MIIRCFVVFEFFFDSLRVGHFLIEMYYGFKNFIKLLKDKIFRENMLVGN